MLKNTILSVLIGALAYLAIGVIEERTLIPQSPVAIAELIIIIIAIFLGTIFASKGASKGASGSDASSWSADNSDQENGTVKWFNVKKGYGFITRDQGDDVFVHYRNIEGQGRRAIAEGQRVAFIVIDGDKGLQADEVNVL